jgi:hypothetical protein
MPVHKFHIQKSFKEFKKYKISNYNLKMFKALTQNKKMFLEMFLLNSLLLIIMKIIALIKSKNFYTIEMHEGAKKTFYKFDFFFSL